MTYAPDDLLAVRRYLMRITGLDAASLGIQGDPAHASSGGYHEGNDDLSRVGRLGTDYSKRESARDRPGTNAASALDIGDFVTPRVSLRSLTLGLVQAAQHGDPRMADVREIIHTPDGSTVRRWDRLGIRSTGDSSHLYHTHLSFFRDSEGRRAGSGNILGILQELIEGKATIMASEWHLGEPNGSAITQGPAHPRTDPVWVPDTIAGQQRDTVTAHAWHASILAALGVQELLKRPAEPDVVLSPEQLTELANQFLAAVGPGLRAIVDEAIEDVLRRALGPSA